MKKYKEPNDYKNIHEFMDKHGDKINKGIIEEEFMMEACDYILEMASSDLRMLTSHIRRLYLHLLKYKYQSNRQTRSWINSIRNSLLEIEEAMENKSLANKIDMDSMEVIYMHARKDASRETHLSIDIFPKVIPELFIINNFINTNKIEQFLIDNAISIEAKKELDL